MWLRILALVFLCCSLAWGKVDASFFLPTYENHFYYGGTEPGRDTAHAADYEYVFLGGLFGLPMNLFGGYFNIFKAELEALGVPEAQIHEIHFPLGRPVEENAIRLLGDLEKIAGEAEGRPLVLNPHSKATAEVVQWTFNGSRAETILQNQVEGIFLLQGALQGSPIADGQLWLPVEGAENVGLGTRVGFGATSLAVQGLRWKIGEGMESITTEASAERLLAWIKTGWEPEIADKVVAVRAHIYPSRNSPILQMMHWYLHAVEGGAPGDGLVALEAQTIPLIPDRNVVTIEGQGHAFPCSRLLSWQGPAAAQAYIRALVASIGH